jgi:hypothetical protein
MKRFTGRALLDVSPLLALFAAAGIWAAANGRDVQSDGAEATVASNGSIGTKKPHYRFSEADIQPMVQEMANQGITNFVVWIDPNTGALDVVTQFDAKPHLDIKPGSCPNSVNVLHGEAMAAAVVPMALLGNAFDVTQVDVGTVRCSPALLQEQGDQVELSPVHISFADVGTPFESDSCACAALGPDGVLDLVINFDRQEMIDGFGLQSQENNSEFPLKVTGLLTDGQAIFGTRDCIRIVQ